MCQLETNYWNHKRKLNQSTNFTIALSNWYHNLKMSIRDKFTNTFQVCYN